MHRIAATPGGWNSATEGVIVIQQSPAPIVLLTAADTEIQALSRGLPDLPPDFSPVRVVNLLQLQQQLTIDAYAETVLSQARLIILRILGGRAYWPYGLEVARATVAETGAALVVLPGDERPDLDLISHSTLPLTAVNQLWCYFNEGGPDNLRHGLMFISDRALHSHYDPPSPQPVPRLGPYRPAAQPPATAKAAILFYRAHYLAGNTAAIDALCDALAERGITPVPLFVSSLKDPDIQAELIDLLKSEAVECLLNTTSFAIAQLDSDAPGLWQTLDLPVLQVILSGGPLDQWQRQPQGLSPRDIAMNVALPEIDGRIITRAVSFKALAQQHPQLQTDVVTYQPQPDRVAFVAELAARWIRLKQTPPRDRKIALILANYPNRDGRLANGVGLDTPESCVQILAALRQAGYRLDPLPTSGDWLIRWLTQGQTNDPEGFGLRPTRQQLAIADYQTYFDTLPAAVQQGISQRWGAPTDWQGLDPRQLESADLPIPGIQLGHIFVGIQPSRGYDADPSLSYHAPDLEPTPAYLGFYHWIRTVFQADAIVHVGKHGNLEWLPGKGIALSESCYPEVALGPMPHFYPFIVNDPGEGAQAKRRAQAVILDHLTPPLTRAELYGPLQQLENLVDEYYEAQSLDPTRLPLIGDRICQLLQATQLQRDLNLEPPSREQLTDWLPQIDGYLCQLKEAQIRDGLHIFGQCPSGRQLRDLAVAIARAPSRTHGGLTRAVAAAWQLDLDPLNAELGQSWPDKWTDKISPKLQSCRTVGDVVEQLEAEAARWVEALLQNQTEALPDPQPPVLDWIAACLLPALKQTTDEIAHLLRGLNGQYVPSGPAGAPTRNRPEVLPTGRNFYSVDIRAIPTESAWDVGRRAAELLVEDYVQTQGDYPRTLGLSMWGTAAMRTGGDDLAEALALIGVRPVWDGPSRRVVDFEILPLAVLGRPRVDVTLRISGFFRDAFPNLIDLFDQAVAAVAALDEPPAQNPLAAQVRQETADWQAQGLSLAQAETRSRYRIFGSKPGAYGAGLQGLIDAQNWTDQADLARAYLNWSGYAYSRQGNGRSAPEAFQQRLEKMQVVLHNQDNREHDLLDSDDYYQFQGGLTAAVRTASGQSPQVYFGDHSRPENPQVRSLAAEIARVYRSRVINPKWIAGVMRHGYKGAFEMAATVDYLFAYDATTGCVADHMYEGVAQAYLLDPQVQQFVEQANPWALRDMAERLLEAHQRGLWKTGPAALLDQLRSLAHQAEGTIESQSAL